MYYVRVNSIFWGNFEIDMNKAFEISVTWKFIFLHHAVCHICSRNINMEDYYDELT